MSGRFTFDTFILDVEDRRLTRDGVPVTVNARYLDALALMVGEAGRLVTKDRFMNEVWRGVPVTDEALTQCIRTLRRQLGDDAANPRFIETVPKHGYRFVAAVCADEDGTEAESAAAPHPRARTLLRLAGAGTAGAGIAGLIGGFFYGFAGAAPGWGAVSVVLVLTAIVTGMALLGGAGVSFGIAAARRAGGAWHRDVLGGAAGGMIVGALVKLIGIDAFDLLFGQSPGDITGAAEGAVLGGAAGLGAWLARGTSVRRGAAIAAAIGGAAGLAIALAGGRLMGGSLALLAAGFPGSRLDVGAVGAPFGEAGFGPVSAAATAGLEAALFCGCLVGAMRLWGGRSPSHP